MTGSDKENAMEKNAPKQCPYCRAAAIGADGKCSDPVCAARPGPTAGNVVEGLGRLKAQMESPAFAAAVFEDTAAATEAARLGAEFGAIAGLAKQGAAAAPLSLERLVRLSVNAGTTVARNHGHISQIEARAWEYAQALLTQAGRAALCREIAARLPAEERERLAAELSPWRPVTTTEPPVAPGSVLFWDRGSSPGGPPYVARVVSLIGRRPKPGDVWMPIPDPEASR